MSDVPSDPARAAAGGGSDQPSEEEVRAYLEQLRVAPVEQVVAEVASALLNAAQVKLGRRDGRLLIDLVAGIADRGRGVLPDDITDQLDQALTQLRMAQVEAEREVADAGAQGQNESSDLGATSSEADERSAVDEPGGRSQPTAPTQPGSRLWVPGR